jgi:ubiquinone/menaquinone biosynthesis C-methylase UbiE
MPSVFWTGKLTWPMKVMVNSNNLLAWLTGNARNSTAMKKRVKSGYDGEFTDHVTRYDELGLPFQTKAAQAQLEGLDLGGKDVLDIGCGSGVISFLALEKGARKVTCGDISTSMLEQSKRKAAAAGYGPDKIDFRELDAESLPFGDSSFDVVMTGMTLGLIPDQDRAIAEMVRVAKSGGLVAVGAHGKEHYWEAIDASFRAITKRFVLGYRLEFWPRSEAEVRRMMERAGLGHIQIKRFAWKNDFGTGGQAYDFFAAISASFWYAQFPPEKRIKDSRKTREYFERKKVKIVTDDVVLGYGWKP